MKLTSSFSRLSGLAQKSGGPALALRGEAYGFFALFCEMSHQFFFGRGSQGKQKRTKNGDRC
jgi:hypothetical protein